MSILLLIPLESLKQLYQQRPGFDAEFSREDVTAQVTVSGDLIDKTLELLNAPAIKDQADFALQAFKTFIGILQIISGDSSLGH